MRNGSRQMEAINQMRQAQGGVGDQEEDDDDDEGGE